MARNILIFSDGTGQAGGRTPDQDISNVYKLYRATRCDTDSTVDPRKQIAFYDAGLGTDPEGLRFMSRTLRRVRNTLGLVFGLGIDQNIIDCYAALMRTWRPGDRIFLIGFSRGAFTVRCVAGVLARCGLPTERDDGKPLLRDAKSAEQIASRAVSIYQHGARRRTNNEDPLKTEREELAAAFRKEFGSGSLDIGGKSNATPYFIGVFDTVATIGSMSSLAIIGLPLLLLVAAISFAICMPSVFSISSVFILSCLSAFTIYTFVQSWRGKSNWRAQLLRKLIRPFKFYDDYLGKDVSYARHAVSIDENRSDFQILLWEEDAATDVRNQENVRRLKQVWFAGVHSDIGGSYPEAESRLSDIALEWMVDELNSLPEVERPEFAKGRLNLFPDPLGMQHDEMKAARGWFHGPRPNVEARGAVHDSVRKRLKASEVLQFDEMKIYRPVGLKGHSKFTDITWD